MENSKTQTNNSTTGTAGKPMNFETRDYEVTVWEKAEHWRFYETIQASSREEAWKKARAIYPAKDYRITDVR